MRQIRFRAWKDEEMIGDFPNTLDTWENKDLYILMQYTGLKDCNGREIYEDDIVEFESFLESKKVRVKVFFSDGCFIIDGVSHHPDKYTVVGNIHQNPELLDNNPTND